MTNATYFVIYLLSTSIISVVSSCMNVHIMKVRCGYEIIGTVMLRAACLSLIAIVVSRIMAFLGWP
jgi:hypothetical protein